MSGFLMLRDLGTIAGGLNIEGAAPAAVCAQEGLPHYSLVQVIDEPLQGITFDAVMATKAARGCASIEEAAGLDAGAWLAFVCGVTRALQAVHPKLLVHVHQYTGTTDMDARIAAATGAQVMLDVTNFFETPVQSYRAAAAAKQGGLVDAVLSLSQCAGLAYPVGTWIAPTAFLEFDVQQGIVRTAGTPAASADITPYLDAEAAAALRHSPILVVNALWNPTPEQVALDGVLLLDGQDMGAVRFVQAAMAGVADAAHGMDHILRVARAATRACNTKATLLLALVHDVCDHKLAEGALPRAALTSWLVLNNGDVGVAVEALVDRVSFSTQRDAREPDVPAALVAVRDADRADALGQRGLQRCEQVVRSRGGVVPRDVARHAVDKLLRLIPEGYITHPTAADIVAHNVVAQYVRDNVAALAPLL